MIIRLLLRGRGHDFELVNTEEHIIIVTDILELTEGPHTLQPQIPIQTLDHLLLFFEDPATPFSRFRFPSPFFFSSAAFS
jgi:hypothetical protein